MADLPEWNRQLRSFCTTPRASRRRPAGESSIGEGVHVVCACTFGDTATHCTRKVRRPLKRKRRESRRARTRLQVQGGLRAGFAPRPRGETVLEVFLEQGFQANQAGATSVSRESMGQAGFDFPPFGGQGILLFHAVRRQQALPGRDIPAGSSSDTWISCTYGTFRRVHSPVCRSNLELTKHFQFSSSMSMWSAR